MPQIDVTPELVSGFNSASRTAEGAVRGQQIAEDRAHRQELVKLAKQAAAERSQLLDARLDEIDARREGERGELAALEWIAGARAQKFNYEPPAVTGEQGFWGGDDAALSTRYRQDEREGLEKYLRQQRENAEGFAGTLSDRGRAAFFREVLPGIDDDEANERDDMAARHIGSLWEEAAESGLLTAGDAAAAPEALEGLQSGVVTPAKALESLRAAKNNAARKFERQTSYQEGLKFWQKSMEEVSLSGAAATAPLSKAFSEWMKTDDLDLQDLQRRVIMARYGVDPKAKKIGSREVTPETAPFGSAQWRRIAGAEARKEAAEFARMDPRVRQLAANKDPGLGAAYEKALEEAEDVALASYAAQWGATDEQIESMLSPKRAKALAKARLSDIKTRLESAGLGDMWDTPISKYHGEADKVGKGAPVEQDLTGDGEMSEADIDAAYEDGPPGIGSREGG